MPGRAIQIDDDSLHTNTLFSAEGYNKLFKVLYPQRRFKWDKVQVGQLWRDILNAYEQQRPSYFLGTLLLAPLDEQEVSIIDGQQRITTLSILLAVLRDCCENKPNLKGRAARLQQLIARVDNDGNPVGSLVVTLQEPDDGIYATLVKWPQSTASLASTNAINDRVMPAARLLRGLVTDYIDNESNPEGALRNLCEYIQTRVKLLPLEVASEGQAYLVFDTTNTRGLRLSPAEALKARLATIARKDPNLSDDLIKKWNAAAAALERAGLPIDAMDDYVHALWSSKAGYTSKRNLDKIASKFDDSPNKIRELIDFAGDIGAYYTHYLAVVSPSGNSRLTEDIKDLNRLNMQANSFLTMVHKHAHEKFDDAVQLTLSLQIRNVTIGNDRPNAYEKDWPDWTNKVREGNASAAFKEIRDRMTPDDEFIELFKEAHIDSSSTARHLLRKLDPVTSNGSGVLPYEVDREHIFPTSVASKLLKHKKLSKNAEQWIVNMGFKVPDTITARETLGLKLKGYCNMLGNQALLNLNRNRKGKDRQFSKKKDYYQDQALELTKQLCDEDQWNADTITQRQEQLAQLAPGIWRK